MLCDPYAPFGFRAFPDQPDLPACGVGLTLDQVEAISSNPNPFPDDPYFSALRPDQYAAAAANLRAELATRQRVGLGETGFFAYLAQRLSRLEGLAMDVVPFDQQALAEALIRSGQLTLPPEAFQTEAARFALAKALQPDPVPALPIFRPNIALGGSNVGILDSILGGLSSVGGAVTTALPSIIQALPALAQAGVIRGDVGAFFAPSMPAMMNAQSALSPVGFSPAQLSFLPGLMGTIARNPAAAGAAGAILGDIAIDSLQGLFGGGASCGASRPAVMAPTLFRTNACGKASLPARTQVIGPDGAIYVVASLGRATRGSRERSVMKRLARDNGFKIARSGSGGGGRRRRPL